MTWRLKRTAQCDKCPWLAPVEPIDLGYAMRCEENPKALCVGWVVKQAAHSEAFRKFMLTCENAGAIRLRR